MSRPSEKGLRRNGYRFLEKMLAKPNYVCPICKERLDIEGIFRYVVFMKYRKRGQKIPAHIRRHNIDVNIDHIIPIAKGGGKELDNVQFIHPKCNIIKGDSIL